MCKCRLQENRTVLQLLASGEVVSWYRLSGEKKHSTQPQRQRKSSHRKRGCKNTDAFRRYARVGESHEQRMSAGAAAS